MSTFNVNGEKNVIRVSFDRDDIDHHFQLRNLILTQEIEGFNKNTFVELSSDLSGLLYEVKCIVDRINEDIKYCYLYMDLFEKAVAHSKDNNKSQSEIDALFDESFSYNKYINYFRIDVKTLYIWIKICMDKIPKYLRCFISRSHVGIRVSNYHRFLKSIQTQRGKEIELLKLLLNAYEMWSNEIKDIREDYIIHHIRTSIGSISTTGDRDHITSTFNTVQHNKEPSIAISNEIIESHLLLFRKLLKDINLFLIENLEKVPF